MIEQMSIRREITNMEAALKPQIEHAVESLVKNLDASVVELQALERDGA